MQIGDNLHEVSNPIFREKKKKEREKYFNMSSVENFTLSDINVNHERGFD